MPPIPDQFSEVYDTLATEIQWLHIRWICYRQIFEGSQRRFDMLNNCAPMFFMCIQDALFGEVQVNLSKLTDPSKTGMHENLSLEQLQNRLEIYSDSNLASKNRKTLKTLQDQCTPFRIWRNKTLAHLDLLTSMKATPDPLPDISHQMIEDALGTLRGYMNAIEQYYNNKDVGYEHFLMSGSDGNALLAVIRSGLRYEELLQEQKIPYDDYLFGKWHEA